MESTLEEFLRHAVSSGPGRAETRTLIDKLDEIAVESLKGRRVTNQLGDWLARNQSSLESGRLLKSDLTNIANLLGDIKSGLDDNDQVSKKLSETIDSWRQAGVIPKRRLVLKGRSEDSGKNLISEFAALLAEEAEYISSGVAIGDHLLSILDDILLTAEAKENRMFLHLAGSIVYYLKINGYKVGPFVKRLKEIY
jgi:hypothetical protein